MLDRLEVELKPMTEKNRIVFSKYLESVRKRLVTGPDLVTAKKFVEYLYRHEIGPLNSWSDIFEASKQVNIRYSYNKPRCPILQIGRFLERKGAIAPLKSDKSFCRSRVSARLNTKTQALVEEYFIKITKIRSARYGLFTIAVVRRFETSLNAKSLFDATEDDAREFIAKRPRESLSQSGNFIRHMKVFYNWLAEQNPDQVNPFENLDAPKTKRLCPGCGEEKKFINRGGICSQCYSKKHSANRLVEIAPWELEGDKLREYNRDIFKLYLRYISRHHLDAMVIKDTALFFSFLQYKIDLPTIQSWAVVLELASELKKFTAKKSTFKRGCPFIKVAHVLQELCILPIREEAYCFKTAARINALTENLVMPAHRYVELLRKTKRSEKTINIVVQGLTKYHDWLKLNGNTDFFTASETMLRNYLLSCKTDVNTANQILNKFYSWAKTERYTLSNPLENIPRPTKKGLIRVCSSEQIAQVEKFIKSPTSDPESAMILALVFYWGVKCKELRLASVEFENHNLTVIFHRGTLSYNNRKYRRNQTLRLPMEPIWLRLLQKRFEKIWQDKFKQVRRDLPRQPLILHSRRHHTRAMHSLSVGRIYYRSIKSATNVKIPLNVLRRSGADMYSKQNGAAILERMGWSKTSAFNFIWKPRQLFALK